MSLIVTNLKELLEAGIVEVDDIDPGVFDSYAVCDGYSVRAELEPHTWGEFTMIQRVLDEDDPDHLILIDHHGNSTNVGSAEVTIRLYQEAEDISNVVSP